MAIWDLFQRQPVNTQPQIPGPPPAPGLPTPRRGQLARNGIDAPFAANDPIAGPGRASERINSQQQPSPLNGFLAEQVPAETSVLLKFAHRIMAPLSPYYPLEPGYDPYATYQASDPDAVRGIIPGRAPTQFQRSPGGIFISQIETINSVVNSDLATVYSGAVAPVSANQSNACK